MKVISTNNNICSKLQISSWCYQRQSYISI